MAYTGWNGFSGEKLKQARKNAKMTQQQLAEKCKTKDSAIRRLENSNIEPRFDTALKLASALGIEVWELYENVSLHTDGEVYSLHDGVFILDRPSTSKRIAAALDKLNETGKEVAADRVEELTKIPDYQK